RSAVPARRDRREPGDPVGVEPQRRREPRLLLRFGLVVRDRQGRQHRRRGLGLLDDCSRWRTVDRARVSRMPAMSDRFSMNSYLGQRILSLVREGDYAHAGEEEAIELAMSDVEKDSHRVILDVG